MPVPHRGRSTQSGPPLDALRSRWGPQSWAALLGILTLLTLLVHGYHPLAEDGGLYVAGVEYKLDPTLFPHYTEFVREHLRFSVFAPVVAALVRLTHLSLAWVLLVLDLLSIWLTLFAARQVLRRCVLDEAAQLAGVALLAAWWTLPVAGTSLLMMDPYVTARSFSMPLSLLAIAFALDNWKLCRWSLARCILCLALATVFHPLMAGYATACVVLLRVTRLRQRRLAWGMLALAAFAAAALVQALAPPESAALQAAAITRYYWFLSQWHWYELLGLAGPVLVLGLISGSRRARVNEAALTLCRACLVLAAIATLIVLVFAREGAAVHMVARLQLLRVYLLLYAVMAMLLGATLWQLCSGAAKRSRSATLRTILLSVPVGGVLAMATIMFVVQRLSFPSSPHIELPWRAAQNRNPWVRAFLWCRGNTPRDALFALDAKYVNTEGEDAQTFRATSLRSAVPDYSKDGGEASITPGLAEQWQQGAAAQKDLSKENDKTRDVRLRPLGVTWIVLASSAKTSHACPYDNGAIKVCSLLP